MAEGEDKTSSAVKELEGKMKGEKKEAENYYVRLATNMVTTARETRLVEDDTQDTFLKGERLPATVTDFRVSFLQGLLVSLLPSSSLDRVVI